MHKTGTNEDSGLKLKWAPNRAMSVPQETEDQQQKKQLQKRFRHGGPYSHYSAEDASNLLLKESYVAFQ